MENIEGYVFVPSYLFLLLSWTPFFLLLLEVKRREDGTARAVLNTTHAYCLSPSLKHRTPLQLGISSLFRFECMYALALVSCSSVLGTADSAYQLKDTNAIQPEIFTYKHEVTRIKKGKQLVTSATAQLHKSLQ